ncbi:CaiB/BaiF CoA transferase family protein [Sulfodiicoccus acidiphilus]|nr:CoA transferase [Sulfodiicoccus acidiphilus]
MTYDLLKGVKVVDLSRAMAGPYCTMMLADAGADVIKVEPPVGDETRLWGPPFQNGESTYFMSVNRNKRSIVIDLKKEQGKEVLRRLLENADVLVENFRPGVMEKMGFGYEQVSKLNPKIIYCSISGFGQWGPYKDRPGYDLIAYAVSGMMSITGEEGRPPVKAGVPVSDIGAGMFGAFAIVSALFRRVSTGKGEYIDVSLLEGQIAWLTHQAGAYFATGQNPKKMGSAHSSIAPYQAFKAKDDYFVLAVGNDEQWARFCKAVGAEHLLNDPRFRSNPDRVRNRDALIQELEKVFSTDSSTEWVRRISEAGIPCSRIYKLSDVFTDPHVLARETVQEIDHPRAGKVKQISPPYKLKGSKFRIALPPPVLGQHTEEVLRELGYSEEQVKNMVKEGSVLITSTSLAGT